MSNIVDILGPPKAVLPANPSILSQIRTPKQGNVDQINNAKVPSTTDKKHFLSINTNEKEKDSFQNFIGQPQLTSQEIISNIINYQPQLSELFNSTNRCGAFRIPNPPRPPNPICDTILSHTNTVMDTFDEQMKLYQLQNINTPLVRAGKLEALLKAGLALHDIGKPIGGSSEQHENTDPIFGHALKELGFTLNEIKFAKKVFLEDILGPVAMTRMKPVDGSKKIIEISKSLGISPQEFLNLQTAFFVSDASYYKDLKDKFSFSSPESKNKITSKSPHVANMNKIIGNLPTTPPQPAVIPQPKNEVKVKDFSEDL